MRCLSCGAKNRSGRTVCTRCGSPLDPKVAVFGGASRTVRAGWGLASPAVEEQPEPPARTSWAPAAALGALAVAGVAAWALTWGPLATREGVALDGDAFPDEAFRAAVERYDLDADGYLSTEEALAVTDLDLAGLGIESLAGVETFPALETLDASGNDLTALDLSGCGALTAVLLANNDLAELTLAGQAQLVSLDVSGNDLAALDLSGCGALQSLDVTGNQIAQLDLTACAELTSLTADADQNATLPVSEGLFPDAGLRAALLAADPDGDGALTQRERDGLSSLAVHDPATESLYGIAWLTGLTELDVSGCSLTTLEADGLPEGLVSLTAAGCGLTSVDLTGLEHLATLDLSDNPLLTSVDLAGLTRLATLDLSGCGLTGTLNLTANTRLAAADLTSNPKLVAVDARGLGDLRHADALACDDGVEVDWGEEEGAPGEGDAPDAEGATAEEGAQAEA